METAALMVTAAVLFVREKMEAVSTFYTSVDLF
jgi:hypothetical protein